MCSPGVFLLGPVLGPVGSRSFPELLCAVRSSLCPSGRRTVRCVFPVYLSCGRESAVWDGVEVEACQLPL